MHAKDTSQAPVHRLYWCIILVQPVSNTTFKTELEPGALFEILLSSMPTQVTREVHSCHSLPTTALFAEEITFLEPEGSFTLVFFVSGL